MTCDDFKTPTGKYAFTIGRIEGLLKLQNIFSKAELVAKAQEILDELETSLKKVPA